MDRRGRFLRLVAEGLVVVASILLAFSIDAWWDDRGEQQAERTLLERLRADFIDVRTMLQSDFEEHTFDRNACIALLGFAIGQPLPANPEVDAMVARVILRSRTVNPGSGATETFLNSDDARLIHNQPLSDLLLAWPGLVEDLQEEEASLQKGVSERWHPTLPRKPISDLTPRHTVL